MSCNSSRRPGPSSWSCRCVVWALSTLPNGELETSYLAGVGKALAPLGALMGLDWKMVVALLTSLVAKENSVATLGVLFGDGTAA